MPSRREELAQRYAGAARRGLEIGAQASPWPLPFRPLYVDSRSKETLLAEGVDQARVVAPDHVEDGNTLPSFAPRTFDALCASHVLEHMRDPVGALRRWHELLAPSGVILGAVPEKPRMFDCNREVTPYALLRAAHEGGPPAVAAFAACQRADWFYRYGGQSWPEAVGQAVRMAGTETDVHFSVWDWQAFHVFVTNTVRDYLPGAVLREFFVDGMEILFVIQAGPA